jgi:hypothetical protein
VVIIKKTKDKSTEENVEKNEHLHTDGGNVNSYSDYGKHYGGSSRNEN